MHLKQPHSGWLNTCMILGTENVFVDLVNITFGFMLLGSISKPVVGEFKSLLTDSYLYA